MSHTETEKDRVTLLEERLEALEKQVKTNRYIIAAMGKLIKNTLSQVKVLVEGVVSTDKNKDKDRTIN